MSILNISEGGYLFFDDEGGKFAAKGLIRTPIMDFSKHADHCLRFLYDNF